MVCDDVNKKYVRKETVTITRTEEISLVDDKSSKVYSFYFQLVKVVYRLIKKYIFLYKGSSDVDG
jgi:hypothetical protein